MLLQVNSVIGEKDIESVEIEPHGSRCCCVLVVAWRVDVAMFACYMLYVGGDGSGGAWRVWCVVAVAGARGVLGLFIAFIYYKISARPTYNCTKQVFSDHSLCNFSRSYPTPSCMGIPFGFFLAF